MGTVNHCYINVLHKKCSVIDAYCSIQNSIIVSDWNAYNVYKSWNFTTLKVEAHFQRLNVVLFEIRLSNCIIMMSCIKITVSPLWWILMGGHFLSQTGSMDKKLRMCEYWHLSLSLESPYISKKGGIHILKQVCACLFMYKCYLYNQKYFNMYQSLPHHDLLCCSIWMIHLSVIEICITCMCLKRSPIDLEAWSRVMWNLCMLNAIMNPAIKV